MKRIWLLLMAWILVGCAPENSPTLPDQQWQDVTVHIEARPTPLKSGTSEFWVILNDPRGLPVFDVMVNLRADAGGWQQAIQDGHTGVYRRAVLVKDPASANLTVRLRRREQAGDLIYPLAPIAASAAPVSTAVSDN